MARIGTMTTSSKQDEPLTFAVDAAAPEAEGLIPGLPDEVSEQILLHLPFPHHALARSVSSTWNRSLTSAAFLRLKAAAPPLLASPNLFVFAYHRSSLRLHWQALDLHSRRWFLLPPMPLPATDDPLSPPAFATAAIVSRGEIYVLGGMRSDAQSPIAAVATYRAATNSWSPAAPMRSPRAFFAAGAIGGRIVAAAGDAAGGAAAVESYDPALDRWAPAARMQCGLARYDSAVVGTRMYVTEGWTWPFTFSPRGGMYDVERDTWEDMSEGMLEGWTGASAVVGGRVFVVSEYGDRRVKVYEAGSDEWRAVDGGGVPKAVKRPFAVAGSAEGGSIYVAGNGLDVAVGTVARDGEEKGWKVEWEVVKGPQPPAFGDLVPCSAHLLYV